MRLAVPDTNDTLILGSEGYGCELRLVAHLGKEKGNRHCPEGAVVESFILALERIATKGPKTKKDEGGSGCYLDIAQRYEAREIIAGYNG